MPPFATPLLTHLLAAIVAAAGSFYVAWQMQAGNVSAVELKHANSVLEATNRTNDAWRGIVANSLSAAASAANREVDTRKRLDGARSERDGLQRDLEEATARLATATPAACLDRAAALSAVLNNCTGAYSELAGKAERHANDIQTLTEAWPQIK